MIDTQILPKLEKKSQKLFKKALNHLHSIPLEKDKHTHLLENIRDIIRILYNEMFLGMDSIIASMFYRPIQYKYININQIEKTYGPNIARISAGAARIAKLSKTKMQYHADYFIHLVLTLVDDPHSIFIMLSEQLDKMRNFKKLPENVKGDILNEIFFLYAPIAHRLGLYAIKTELEELWLKRAHYPIFRKIADDLAAKKNERKAFIARFITPLQEKIERAGISCTIKGRPKSIYSIWKKMNAQQVSLDNIYDKFAIRIIIDEPKLEKEKELCWKVYSLITEKYRPNPQRLRDWISLPKVSGYESLHTTVATEDTHWIEIQIRTRRMDDIAEKGDAAHWRYKESTKSYDNVDWLVKMRESLINPDDSENKGLITAQIPLANHIYVFTPDEDLIRLKKDSTILDFAFHVHTTVGLTCTGARVNGHYVPIKYVLNNGDVVEIITSKNQKPSEQWLKIVTSSRVRSKVKRAIRRNEQTSSEIGKEMLRQKFNTLGIAFTSENLDKVAEYFDQKTVTTLFENIGQLKIDLLKVKRIFVEPENVPEVKVHDFQEKTKPLKKNQKKKHNDCIIIDKAIQGIEYTMASCCNPVMGDSIFCFITVSKGIRVHKSNCPNALSMRTHSPHRIIEAKWAEVKQTQLFTTQIKVSGSDERNVLSAIVNTFKDVSGAKMMNCNINTSITNFTAELSIDVADTETLNAIMTKIRKIKGVVRVWRVR